MHLKRGTFQLIPTDAKTFDKTSEYACLSYCWGGEAPKVSLRNGSIGSLPADTRQKPQSRIFIDAMRATCELGLRYLWIDALCIDQADREEFEIESLRMGDIYANATVTIMAAAAKDCSSTFLVTLVERRMSQVFWVCRSHEQRIRPDVYVRRRIQEFAYEPGPSFSPHSFVRGHHFAHDSEVDSRAWCLQEELLSSRVIRFETQQLNFRCSESAWAEDGRSERPSEGSSWDEGVWNSSAKHSDFHLRGLNPYLAEKWTNTISSVSARALTHARDILPCTSGLAARYLKLSGEDDEYLAGTWKKGFIEYLLWSPTTPRFKAKTTKYLAPSWSWPSPGDGVDFSHYLGVGSSTAFSNLVGAECVRVGKNPFGKVSSGYARVEGPFMSMYLDIATDFMAMGKDFQLTHQYEFSALSKTFYLGKEDLDLDHRIWKPGEVHILILTKRVKLSSRGEIATEWFLLILRRSSDCQDETYERIGLWRPNFVELVPFDGEQWLQEAQRKVFKIV